VVYDATRPPSAAPSLVDLELAHAIDIVPTVLDYAGHPIPPMGGRSLKPYVDGTPPPAPLRNTLCGHRLSNVRPHKSRYILTRPGIVGRCAPAAGATCASDAECAGGVCLLGACASGHQCLEDDDCPAGEQCGLRAQKWCRYGRHPVNELAIPPVDRQPTTPCTTDADCAAGCPSADPLYCSCEYRRLKLYVHADGLREVTDLFVDPDEPGLDRRVPPLLPGDVAIGPADPARHLADRLACCLDRWWVPPAKTPLGDPTCGGCEPAYRCDRCGDGIVDAAEQCNGAHLGGASCTSIPGGFGGGTLACTAACTFDTSGCTLQGLGEAHPRRHASPLSGTRARCPRRFDTASRRP
jgi:hypothetical protein